MNKLLLLLGMGFTLVKPKKLNHNYNPNLHKYGSPSNQKYHAVLLLV